MNILTKSVEQIRQGSLLYQSKLGFCLVLGMRKATYGAVVYDKDKPLEEILRTRVYFIPFDLVDVVKIDFMDKNEIFIAVMKLRMMRLVPQDLLDDWVFTTQTGFYIKQAQELKEHDLVDIRNIYSIKGSGMYYLEKVSDGFAMRPKRKNGSVIIDDRENILPLKSNISFLVPKKDIKRITKLKNPIFIDTENVRFKANYDGLSGAIITSLTNDKLFDFIIPEVSFSDTFVRPQDFEFVYPNCKRNLLANVRRKYPYDKDCLYNFLKENTTLEKGLYGYIVSFNLLASKFYIPRRSDYETLLHTMEYIFLTVYRDYH